MHELEKKFQEKFGFNPKYHISTPSRVNLIGEHSDYFGGLVLPMATENIRMEALVRPRKDKQIRMWSLDLDEDDCPYVELTTQDWRRKEQWVQYVQGAIAMYAEEYTRKKLRGFDILIQSNIPSGGGLSSSSALTMTALAALGLSNGFTDGERKLYTSYAINVLNRKNGDEKSRKFLRKICMMGCWAEYWYGTRGGSMDHFAVTVSRKGSATLLENKDYTYRYVDIPKELAIVVCNTNVKHNQLYSGFAKRKEQAHQGFEKIVGFCEDVKDVADITEDQLEKHRDKLTDREYRRLKHPATEQRRVREFEQAAKNNDFERIGLIIEEAFQSLKNDYEVSCNELNIIQMAAKEGPGCFGARITGGGFGGSIVAFVKKNKVEEFILQTKKRYDEHSDIKKIGVVGDFWEAHPGDGLTVEKI